MNHPVAAAVALPPANERELISIAAHDGVRVCSRNATNRDVHTSRDFEGAWRADILVIVIRYMPLRITIAFK